MSAPADRWVPPLLAAAGVGAVARHALRRAAEVPPTDLAVYHAGAKAWLAGRDPRDFAVIAELAEGPFGGGFLGPAWTWVALAPIGTVPLADVAGPWRVAGALLVSLAAAAWTATSSRPWAACLGVVGAAVASRATLELLAAGNLEPVVVAAVAAAAVWPRARGLAVGLAGALKLWPWALAVAGGARGVGVALAGVLATDLLLEGELLRGARDALVGEASRIQPTLLGAIRATIGVEGAAATATWAAVALPLAAAAAWRLRDAPDTVRFRLAALGLLVLAPRGWPYVWLGGIGPIGATWAGSPAAAVAGGIAAVAAAAGLVPDPFGPWLVGAVTWGVALARRPTA